MGFLLATWAPCLGKMLGAQELAPLIQIKAPAGGALQRHGQHRPAPIEVFGPWQRRARRDRVKMIGKLALTAMMLSGAYLAPFAQARAVDLTGAWATSADECNNVFVQKGKAIEFAPMSEMHGGGFFVEQNQIVGRTAKCSIKAKKDDGQTVNIVASCATDIMLSSVQFELNVISQDKIKRLFPGMEDMEIFYYRCQL
jgi:hypothetical protein